MSRLLLPERAGPWPRRCLFGSIRQMGKKSSHDAGRIEVSPPTGVTHHSTPPEDPLEVKCLAHMPPALFEPALHGNSEPMRDGESYAEFLCRSNRPAFCRVRELLNEWHETLPPAEQARMRHSLKSRDRRAFAAAFWELYLHAIFCSLSCHTTLHPSVPGQQTHPDFLITVGSHAWNLVPVGEGKVHDQVKFQAVGYADGIRRPAPVRYGDHPRQVDYASSMELVSLMGSRVQVAGERAIRLGRTDSCRARSGGASSRSDVWCLLGGMRSLVSRMFGVSSAV